MEKNNERVLDKVIMINYNPETVSTVFQKFLL